MATAINLIANLIILFSLIFFVIGVFGCHNAMTNNMSSVEQIFVKTALSATSSGAFFNILTLQTPIFSEILLNIGLGLLFLWACIFHWKYFVNKKNK